MSLQIQLSLAVARTRPTQLRLIGAYIALRIQCSRPPLPDHLLRVMLSKMWNNDRCALIVSIEKYRRYRHQLRLSVCPLHFLPTMMHKVEYPLASNPPFPFIVQKLTTISLINTLIQVNYGLFRIKCLSCYVVCFDLLITSPFLRIQKYLCICTMANASDGPDYTITINLKTVFILRALLSICIYIFIL